MKILLISHAHWDHCAGSVAGQGTDRREVHGDGAGRAEIENGGKGNFQYGNTPTSLYKPVKVDRVLHDGDEVKLGDTVLTAHLTPGHTKGCTTWTMKAKDGEKTYDVVIVGSPNVNAGYRLVNKRTIRRSPRIMSDVPRR